MGVGDVNSILNEASSPYRQFPLQLSDSQLDQFLALFKRVLYFATFAHAPKVGPEASPKYDSWEWVQKHARLYVGRPPDVSFHRRGAPGGMAGIFGWAPVALGRLKYALHWPMPLCSGFIYLWWELPGAPYD